MGQDGVELGTAHTLVIHKEVNFAADLCANLQLSGQVRCVLACNGSSLAAHDRVLIYHATMLQPVPADLIAVAKRSKRYKPVGGGWNPAGAGLGFASRGTAVGGRGGGRGAAAAGPTPSWQAWRHGGAARPAKPMMTGFVASSKAEMPAQATVPPPPDASGSATSSAGALGDRIAALREMRARVRGTTSQPLANHFVPASQQPAAPSPAPVPPNPTAPTPPAAAAAAAAAATAPPSAPSPSTLNDQLAAAVAAARRAAAAVGIQTAAGGAVKRGRWDDGGDTASKSARTGWDARPGRRMTFEELQRTPQPAQPPRGTYVKGQKY